MQDFATRRRTMVDTQVRPSDVTDFTILDAMLNVPREIYVPEAMGEAAYLGENVAISPGRVLLDPRTIAKMLFTIGLGPDDLVLDVGCGNGYSAALAARLAGSVVAVEEVASMAGQA